MNIFFLINNYFMYMKIYNTYKRNMFQRSINNIYNTVKLPCQMYLQLFL